MGPGTWPGSWHTAGRCTHAHTDNTVPESRKDADALYAAAGKRTGAAVAAGLGITAQSPRTWLRKDETQAAPEDGDGSVSAAGELARLRADNARLLYGKGAALSSTLPHPRSRLQGLPVRRK
ncbi:hypothetical protein OG381_48115 [Streptomyces sp. NBC_00490]|uniref:hypothetical protein n=1 Tax=Streptomyces sp. NBC_00490 TaxID=2903657 RepID=UPI002E17883B